jgi:hypothetical protein
MNKVIKTDIINVDEIENEFSFIFYIVNNNHTYFTIFYNEYDLFTSDINYMLAQQKQYFVINNLTIFDMFFCNYFDDNGNFQKNEYYKGYINDKYYPNIKEINIKFATLKKNRIFSQIQRMKKNSFNKDNILRLKKETNSKKFRYFKITFKKSFIPYFQSKCYSKEDNILLNNLKEYTKQKGISFNDYIDDWAERLLYNV